VNLRVGDDFRVWKPALKVKGSSHSIDVDDIDLAELIDLTDPLPMNAEGLIVIMPGAFVLVRTLEYVQLPLKSKLAARVEGRSKQARLGMTAHITAPTIHAGFGGRITLEIVNHGPFKLEVRPNQSKLCQLIIEEVSAIPRRSGSVVFSKQSTPLGTPKPRKPR
jgi:dCTP deaminase